MAKQDFREILTNIKKGDPARVYLLMGPESYYIDVLTDALETYLIPEEDRDFNLNIFYGNDSSVEDVVACAQQYPVMAPRKLVVLKEAQTLSQAKVQLEKAAGYVGSPNATTVFAIAFKGDTLNATSKIMKQAAKSDTVIFKSEALRDYQLPAALKDYCAQNKFGIDEKAVTMLCEYIGGPLDKLFGEVGKLMMIKGKGEKRINADDVERHIGVSKEYTSFEFLKAITTKDYPRTMKIIEYFARNPKSGPTPMLTGTLFNYFSKLVICHYLPDKSDVSMMGAVGAKSTYALGDYKTGMRNFTPYSAVYAIHHLREFDTRTKGIGSMQNEYDLLRELVFKIFTT